MDQPPHHPSHQPPPAEPSDTVPAQPSAPGWGYPPGYVPPSAPSAMPARPALVTTAAIALIVLGVLAALFGALVVLVGVLFPAMVDSAEIRRQFGDVGGVLGVLFLVVGGVLLAYGLAAVVSGIFVLSGRAWARISGLVTAVLGILFSLLGVLPTEEGGAGTSIGFGLVLAAYGFVAWTLASGGAWFRR